MMRCKQIHTRIPLLAAGELEGKDADQVQRHVSECPDCRESLDSTRRLRALLALKRHEKPDEFFFRTYISEFHRRLLSEMVQKPSLWARMREFLRSGWDPASGLLRFSGVSMALGVMIFGFFMVKLPKDEHSQTHFSAQHASSQISIVEVASEPSQLVLANDSSSRNSAYVLDRVNYEPSKSGTVILQF